MRETAKGPGLMGQYVDVLLARAGRGDGGRSVVQRYVPFDQAVNVNTEVVVKSVAKLNLSIPKSLKGLCDIQRLLLVLENPIISWVLSPIIVRFIYMPEVSLGRIWA